MKIKMRCTSALLAVLIMGFMAFPAFASQPADDAIAAEFYAHIQDGVQAGQVDQNFETPDWMQYHKLVKIVDSANKRIEIFVQTAIHTEKDDVDKLLKKVDRTIAFVMKMAAASGFEVECEYIAYEIDGQTVLIDPLRVVNSR